MTPVELSIDAELIVEIQRFDNDWLFKWYRLTSEGGLTDVDDFRGGRIRLGGARFGDQQQQLYWQAVDRYLRQKTHAVFKQWDNDTKSYPLSTRRSSIDGVERSLGQFVTQILSRSLATDKRLRGNANPVAHVRPPGQGGAGGEVAYLAAAHRAMIDQAIAEAPRSYWKGLEAFYANNKGMSWLCTAILIPIIGFTWHYFFQ